MVLLASCWGCGSGAPAVSTSDEEGTVKGTVTFKGKPVTEGTVSFDPSNVKRRDAAPRSAPIAKDGTYSVKTLVGDNRVRASFPGLEADRQSSEVELIYYVKPGENTYDLVLPPAQP
jgi:hypothetical protein